MGEGVWRPASGAPSSGGGALLDHGVSDAKCAAVIPMVYIPWYASEMLLVTKIAVR